MEKEYVNKIFNNRKLEAEKSSIAKSKHKSYYNFRADRKHGWYSVTVIGELEHGFLMMS